MLPARQVSEGRNPLVGSAQRFLLLSMLLSISAFILVFPFQRIKRQFIHENSEAKSNLVHAAIFNGPSSLSLDQPGRPSLGLPLHHHVHEANHSNVLISSPTVANRFNRLIFSNVVVQNGVIRVFFDEKSETLPPSKNSTVVVSRWSTYFDEPPSVIALHSLYEQVDNIQVEYIPAAIGQSICTKWTQSALLLPMTHPNNFYHTINDGVLAAFQVFREVNYIHLGRVASTGAITPLSDWEYSRCNRDNSTGSTVYCFGYNLRNMSGSCEIGVQPWCFEGALARIPTHEYEPTLVVHPSLENLGPWGDYYHALTNDLQSWDSIKQNTCFRELIVGRSTTLHLALEIPNDTSETEQSQMLAARQAAMIDFQDFASYLASFKDTGPSRYRHPKLGILRQGIGPENLTHGLFDALDPVYLPPDVYQEYLRVRAANAMHTTLANANASSSKTANSLAYDVNQNRPNVTYIARRGSRRMLNEADFLTYLLATYNVTLRVTTMEEPLLDVIDLVSNTDVLMGMHGAGFTNAIFLRPGASVLEIFPYSGWRPRPMFRNVARALNCTYFEWSNGDPEHAFMVRKNVEHEMNAPSSFYGPSIKEYSIHPQPSWTLADPDFWPVHWATQDTFIDIPDVQPVLDSVMASAGALGMNV